MKYTIAKMIRHAKSWAIKQKHGPHARVVLMYMWPYIIRIERLVDDILVRLPRKHRRMRHRIQEIMRWIDFAEKRIQGQVEAI